MGHVVSLLTHVWISDDSDSARILSPLHSPLTDFLIQGTLPRGFINELINVTALKSAVFDKVSEQHINYLIFF